MSSNHKNTCPVPAGMLMLIGGKENKGSSHEENETKKASPRLEVLTEFSKLITKKDPVLLVVTSASAEGQDETFNEYRKIFEELGIRNTKQVYHTTRKEVFTEELDALAVEADACFFTGGDQLQLTSLYGGTPFLTRLKNRYITDPLVVGGTSAGAMVLSTPMIYAGNEEVQQLGGEIKVTTGLEFLKDVCIDTHFVHRSRFIRLAQVVATNPTCMGMGIEEDTAVIIRKGLEAEVTGSGTVINIKGLHITESSMRDFVNKKPVTIRNLEVDILSSGDTFTIPQLNPPHV